MPFHNRKPKNVLPTVEETLQVFTKVVDTLATIDASQEENIEELDKQIGILHGKRTAAAQEQTAARSASTKIKALINPEVVK